MRYRWLSYRYAILGQSGQTWPFGDLGKSDLLRVLVPARWRPDADTYETSTTVEIIVDLAPAFLGLRHDRKPEECTWAARAL